MRLELKGVSKTFGSSNTIFKDIDFQVESKQIACVVGRSGCGKSTLLKILALITQPSSGSILMDDHPLKDTDHSQLRRKLIAYSFQEPLLLPYLSAIDNIVSIIGTKKDIASKILTEVGLADRLNYKPTDLSVGERKRVDIVRAYLKGSPVLILDEPFSNLDPNAGTLILELIKDHARNDGIVIYSSVEPSETKFADVVLQM